MKLGSGENFKTLLSRIYDQGKLNLPPTCLHRFFRTVFRKFYQPKFRNGRFCQIRSKRTAAKRQNPATKKNKCFLHLTFFILQLLFKNKYHLGEIQIHLRFFLSTEINFLNNITLQYQLFCLASYSHNFKVQHFKSFKSK